MKYETIKTFWTSQQQKCLSLGVPPGRLVVELKAGREVVLDDGTLVKPADVIETNSSNSQVRSFHLKP
jgi:hypothetical protein